MTSIREFFTDYLKDNARYIVCHPKEEKESIDISNDFKLDLQVSVYCPESSIYVFNGEKEIIGRIDL